MVNEVVLPNAINHDGFALTWKNSNLSDPVKKRMARLHEAVVALRGLDDVLEADEFLTDKHNEGPFEYEWLQDDVRWSLRCAKKMVAREMERQLHFVLDAAKANKTAEEQE